MANNIKVVNNNNCFTCTQLNKVTKGSVMCIGCEKRFCNDHYPAHRQTLQKDYDALIQLHDTVRQNLYSNSKVQSSQELQLFKKIDNWEQEMIRNIKTTAATTRTKLMEIINSEQNQIKSNFTSIADDLKANQSGSNYVETDIQDWQKRLDECRQKLEQLQTSNNDFINIEVKTVDWKNAIHVNQRKDKQLKEKSNDVRILTRNLRKSYLTCRQCNDNFNLGYDSDYCSKTCYRTARSKIENDDDDSVCFHGDCVVLLANGSTKLVKDICRDDILKTSNGFDATVLFVVKSLCKNKNASMVKLDNGLIITPWHPIQIDNKWIFPFNIGEKTEVECEAVYNFALDAGHVIFVNGMKCVTLGHNFKGDVIEHPYYGTTKILDDLRAIDVSNRGFIELLPNSVIRDVDTGLACGIYKYNVSSPDEHLHNSSNTI